MEIHDGRIRAVPALVVMGVSGSGKSTVGSLLAARLDVPFADGDDLHPAANVAKMAAGRPLDDHDRRPWLVAVGGWLRDRRAAGTGGVTACSALKRGYRDLLRDQCPEAFFVDLEGPRTLIAARLAARTGHFMPSTLLESQYAALEPLQEDEAGIRLDLAVGSADVLTALALQAWEHHDEIVSP